MFSILVIHMTLQAPGSCGKKCILFLGPQLMITNSFNNQSSIVSLIQPVLFLSFAILPHIYSMNDVVCLLEQHLMFVDKIQLVRVCKEWCKNASAADGLSNQFDLETRDRYRSIRLDRIFSLNVMYTCTQVKYDSTDIYRCIQAGCSNKKNVFYTNPSPWTQNVAICSFFLTAYQPPTELCCNPSHFNCFLLYSYWNGLHLMVFGQTLVQFWIRGEFQQIICSL